MCQCGLRFLQGIFGPFALVLSALLFTQIEHESDTIAPTFFKDRAANHHGNATAILPEVLFLERLESPSCLYLCYGTFVAVAPFCRREIRPSHAPRNEIFAAESQHVQKSFIGFDDLAFEIPDTDSDNVSVDQAPDLRLALCEIAIKTGIFQEDRGLRRKQF